MIQATITTNTNTVMGRTNAITQNFFIFGTWSGASAALYASADGTNYVPLPNAVFTSDGCISENLNPTCYVMVKTTGGGGGLNLTAQLV